MAKAMLTAAPERWKHLKGNKKVFWKQERQAGKNIEEPVSAGKPKKKTGLKKFGVQKTYKSFSGANWDYTVWYETVKKRDQAFESISKQPSYYESLSKVER